MFNNPFLEEVMACIKQEEITREVKSRTPVYLQKTRKSKKLFVLGV